MKKKLHRFFFLFLFFVQFFLGQKNYAFINYYNEDKNIASGRVYDITQDNEGFLWIATDNGVSRFDGKNFYNYSVEQGLPSNDVVQIFKGKDGKIWANCYMKPLSFFNEKKNKFETFDQNVRFFNELWIYKNSFNGNYQAYYSNSLVEINVFPTINKKVLGYPLYPSKDKFLMNYIFDGNEVNFKFSANGKVIEKKKAAKYEIVHTFFFLNALYCYNHLNELHKFSINDNLDVKEDVMKINEKISHFSFNKNKINIITQNGDLQIIDANSFKKVLSIKTKQNPNTAFIDRDGNLWIGTIDNGLLLYKKTAIRKFNEQNKEFQSVLVEGDQIYSGNYFGEFFKNNKKIFDLKNINPDEKNIRISNIISSGKNKILVSDHFLIKNFSKSIALPKYSLSAIKSSLNVSDTLVFLGTSNGLFRYNPQNDKFKKVGNINERILHFLKTKDNLYFMSTSNEIFQIFPNSDKIIMSEMSKNFENDFISAMESSSPNLIWISTDKGNIHLFKNLKFLKTINYKQGLSNNIRCIKAKDSTLWIGTHSDGLIRMDFSLKGDNLDYKFNYINFLQGLTSNTTDAIAFKGDSLVLASDKGLSILSKNFMVEAEQSKPIILQTKINGNLVENSSHYFLAKNQHSISFTLSNVDFSNNYPEIQYAINEPKNWITLKENVLNLEISNKGEKLFLRTANRNQSSFGGTTIITIDKDRYFYEGYLFWVIFGGFIIGLLAYLSGKKIIGRQKFFYEKELERQVLLQQERERIAHDMHDDLGAGVTAVRFQALYIKNKLKEKNLEKDVNDLLITAEEIHKSMREILWNLNSGNNNLGEFIEYVENHSYNFFNKTNIKLHVEKQDIDIEKELTQESRRNLFLCIKEALHNIHKHSEAKNAWIVFQQSDKNFDAIIADDGIGMPEEKRGGNGLQNMKIRMKDVNGTFEVLNTAKGLALHFRVNF